MESKYTSDFVPLKSKVRQPMWSEGQTSACIGKFPFKFTANTFGGESERGYPSHKTWNATVWCSILSLSFSSSQFSCSWEGKSPLSSAVPTPATTSESVCCDLQPAPDTGWAQNPRVEAAACWVVKLLKPRVEAPAGTVITVIMQEWVCRNFYFTS